MPYYNPPPPPPRPTHFILGWTSTFAYRVNLACCTHVNVNSIQTRLSLPPGSGGGAESEAPLYNYKTAHGMVSNMSQNNVLVISNV